MSGPNPQIIFEDTHLVVLEKPAGLLSQGDDTGEPSLVDWLRQYFGRNYVGLVHRLDRNTSGLMVVAKRSKAANRLTESLQKGTLDRKYLAWVKGTIAEPLKWTDWLIKDEATNTVRVTKKDIKGSKIATLQLIPLPKKTALLTASLVQVILETGRSHQIRVQCAHHGHPLLGDIKYGGPRVIGLDRPALHSNEINFPHPMSGEVLNFESKLPKDLEL